MKDRRSPRGPGASGRARLRLRAAPERGPPLLCFFSREVRPVSAPPRPSAVIRWRTNEFFSSSDHSFLVSPDARRASPTL